jgi:hypothetical protein
MRQIRKCQDILDRCDRRAELWRQYVATYQRVMIETPEQFDQFQADFREKYLSA